jgi:alpha/beta superfamily hydrolase
MTQTVRIEAADAGLDLEARLHGSHPVSAVVAPPHPLYGGNVDNPVVVALCEGLVQRGLSALAFNWRGVGASRGRPSGEIADAVADYDAAARYVESARDPGTPLVAAGYSFGAIAALTVAARNPHVSEILAVAPPLSMARISLDKIDHRRRIVVIAAERDDIVPLSELRSFAVHAGAELMIVAGADHFFSRGGLREIRDAAAGVPRPHGLR